MAGLTRGTLARLCRVNAETLRYYEQRGLLPKPARSAANYRIYPPDSVRRVRFIQRAQELGFSLEEVLELLSLRSTPDARCRDVYRRARIKVEDIETKLRSLEAMRRILRRLMSECNRRGGISNCPILDALENDGRSRVTTTEADPT